jgi:hypothetical protein
MTIKKDWKFERRNIETKEITCEVLFRIVDDNRKVSVETTGLIICEIKKWIQGYNEKIIPNLDKDNKKCYQTTKDFVNKWEYRLSGLIAENQPITGHSFSEQYYVKQNYKLLEPNQLLTYNQALFLLLGLNAIELDHSLRDFPVLDGARPSGDFNTFNFIFWDTPQNQALKTTAYINNGKITSEDLLKIATVHGFFTKPKTTNKNKEERDKRVAIVKEVLTPYLKERDHPISLHSLSKKTKFHNLLAKKGLVIIQNDEDSAKQTADKYYRYKALEEYLTNIVNSPWWEKQQKDITKMLTYKPKPKK